MIPIEIRYLKNEIKYNKFLHCLHVTTNVFKIVLEPLQWCFSLCSKHLQVHEHFTDSSTYCSKCFTPCVIDILDTKCIQNGQKPIHLKTSLKFGYLRYLTRARRRRVIVVFWCVCVSVCYRLISTTARS